MSSMTIVQRLRAARLRPSVGLIGVLQIAEAVAPERVCAEEIFRQLALRGTPTSVGTVYRTIQKLAESGLLAREWGDGRKAYYRVPPCAAEREAVRLVCERSGRSVTLNDPALYERLLDAAQAQGIDLAGRSLTVRCAA